jgi:hypothetical protein
MNPEIVFWAREEREKRRTAPRISKNFLMHSLQLTNLKNYINAIVERFA